MAFKHKVGLRQRIFTGLLVQDGIEVTLYRVCPERAMRFETGIAEVDAGTLILAVLAAQCVSIGAFDCDVTEPQAALRLLESGIDGF